MRTGLVRRVSSSAAALILVAIVASPTFAADTSLTVVAPPDQTVHSAADAPNLGLHSFDLGSFTDPSGAGPWTWTAKWGDGAGSSGSTDSQGALPKPSHAFAPGTWQVQVVVRNNVQAMGTAVFQVILVDDGPTIVVPADPQVVHEGAPATFLEGVYDPAPDYPFAVHVAWGDGTAADFSTSNLGPFRGLSHTFAASDPVSATQNYTIYTVAMTVTDALGVVRTASPQVVVMDLAPAVIASTIIELPEGPPSTITLATFTDASVGPWQVSIYGDANHRMIETLTAPGPIEVPYSPDWGNMDIIVTVGDRGNLYTSVTVPVRVVNGPPAVGAVQIVGDLIGGQPAAGHALAAYAAFTDPAMWASPPMPGAESYTCTVDYGDGSGVQAGGVQGSTCYGVNSGQLHTYDHAGTYTVSIVVTDSNGGTGSTSSTISVVGLAPTVTVQPLGWTDEGQTVAAVADFVDPNPNHTTFDCAIDYGDGTVVAGVVAGSTCTGPAHQYRVTGNYTVTVTVTDSFGATGVGTTDVFYQNRAPWVGGLGLVGDTRFGSAPHAVTAVVDPGDGFETYSCTIDYGDGSAILPGTWVPTGWSDDLPRCVFPDHVYPAVGTYTLTAVVTDSGGESGSTQSMETIIPAIPTIQSVSAPSSVPEGSTASASAVFLPTDLNETYACTVDYGDGSGPLAGVVTGSTCQGPSQTFGGPNALLITIAVTSSGGVSSTADAVLSVTNVPPTVAPKSVLGTAVAGAAYAASVTFSDPGATLGETETCTIDYGDGGGWTGVISGNVCQGPQHFYNSKGAYQLVATVTDSYGGDGTYSQAITVYNPRPVVGIVTAPDSVAGGSAFKASAEFATTGRTETYTCAVDYGDGTGSVAGVVTGTACQGPSHTYKKLGTFTINLMVKGSVTGTGSASTTIGVTPPIIAVGPVSVTGSTIEGSSVMAKAGFPPTGLTETYWCIVDYGDNLGTQAGTVSGNTCTGPKHALGRGGSSIVTVAVYGSAGTYGTSSKTINVTNVWPTFSKVTIPSTVKLGTALSVTGTFTDPGKSEQYQVTYTWDDGITTTVLLTPGTRSFSASHTYAKPGVYLVNVSLADGDWVNYDSYVAVYDPARSATGSGTLASPSGACHLSSKCSGASTGTFAFKASYAKGATKPTASFTFSVAGLSYSASAVDAFVGANGTIAMSGTGTVNGVCGYRFTLQAVDGKPDTLFISIVDSKGNTVYQNDGASSLKSGSITLK